MTASPPVCVTMLLCVHDLMLKTLLEITHTSENLVLHANTTVSMLLCVNFNPKNRSAWPLAYELETCPCNLSWSVHRSCPELQKFLPSQPFN